MTIQEKTKDPFMYTYMQFCAQYSLLAVLYAHVNVHMNILAYACTHVALHT